MEDIFLGNAEPLVKGYGIGFKDIDEVVGHDDLLLIYPESYEQFKDMVNDATKMGIKDSFKEIRNGTHTEYQVVVKRS